VEAKVEGVDPACIIVWDIHSQKKLRGFAGNLTEMKAAWPVFKWSHDDSFIARTASAKGEDVISVYQVPDMSLLEKKSIRVQDVGGIEWSPDANILAYHVPEKGNTPAKVSLLELPSKTRLREVHLYSVTGIKMFWQDRGDYLAVQMTRHKTKKTTSTHFEIFRVKTKDIPVENLEIEDQVIAFQWEPKGHRFAVIHSDGGKTHVSVYELKKKQIRFVGKLEDRLVNSLFWSPKGDLLIIASIGPQSAGTIECIDVDVNSSMFSLGQREHYMCRDVEWDPTGRYVITSVCQSLGSRDIREKTENGYKVWTLDGKGKGLFQCSTSAAMERLYQVLWRPRPPTLLPSDKIHEISKTLRDKYFRKFEQEDQQLRQSQMGEEERHRIDQKEKWKKYRADCEHERSSHRDQRAKLRADRYSDDDAIELVAVEEYAEVELDRREEIVATDADDEDNEIGND